MRSNILLQSPPPSPAYAAYTTSDDNSFGPSRHLIGGCRHLINIYGRLQRGELSKVTSTGTLCVLNLPNSSYYCQAC
ncbi:hypothetical protein PT2222_480020 [Paraburkholderia tropica]